MDDFEITALKEETSKFCSILPELFSDDFDRKTLWERIGNGLLVSLQKSGGDMDRFINNCLEFIKADPGKVAANEALSFFCATVSSRPASWKEQFLKYIEKNNYLVVIKARTMWNEKKEMK